MTEPERQMPNLKSYVDDRVAQGKLHPSCAALWAYLSRVDMPLVDDDDPTAERHINYLFCDLAADLIANGWDGPEQAAGLRKLLEARDCFVRSYLFHE